MGLQDENKNSAMAGSQGSSSGPGERADGLNPQKPQDVNVGDRFCFSPWSNWRAWIVMLAGILVGQVIGFSPQLFVGIAAFCLLSGWLFDR
jgi:hypothetical protein